MEHRTFSFEDVPRRDRRGGREVLLGRHWVSESQVNRAAEALVDAQDAADEDRLYRAMAGTVGYEVPSQGDPGAHSDVSAEDRLYIESMRVMHRQVV